MAISLASAAMALASSRVMRSSARGDMYVEVNVETPVNLGKRQQDLLHEFEAESKSRETNPESDGFFTRVKEFWDDLTEK